jgi:hypothetical protein
MTNGLAQREEAVQTPEEIKAEKRFVLKVDLINLPILIVMLELYISHYVGVLNDHRTVATSQMPTPRA